MIQTKVIKLKFHENDQTMKLDLVKKEELSLKFGEFIDTGGTKNYNNLINKPSLNGIELVGNYDEIDPTVPNWAKNETKPDYTPEEIGAVDRNSTMSFDEIKKAWDFYFN